MKNEEFTFALIEQIKQSLPIKFLLRFSDAARKGDKNFKQQNL